MSQIYKALQSQSGNQFIQTITGNDGIPETGSAAGNFNILTANATPQFIGTVNTETLNFGLTNLLLGSSGPLIAGAAANVGYGEFALAGLTTGQNNAVFGYFAGNSLSSGQGNTLLGYSAGNSITTSSDNTLIGSSTGISIKSGHDNTAIGYNALPNLVSGTYNVAIGSGAGTDYTSSETGNILIGSVGGVALDMNSIRIGTQGSAPTQQNTCYIAGIAGVTVSNPAIVTINPVAGASQGQLGEIASVPVSLGGTGQTTLTANATLYGNGTSGIISAFDNQIVSEFDDFISSVSDSGWYVGKLSWQNDGHRIVGTSGVVGHDGIVTTDGSGSINSLFLNNVSSAPPFYVGGGVLAVNWVINIQTLSNSTNRYLLYVGTSDINSAEPNNGFYFVYSDNLNSGDWVLKTANGATRTTQNTSVAVGTGWINLGVVVNAAGTSVSYFINGAQVGSAISTNIPANAIGSALIQNPTSGSAPALLVDLMYYTRIFTTAR